MHKIQNCTVVFRLIPTGSFTMEQFLTIARNGWNIEYNPRRFHGIIMRMRHQQRTVACLVFKSGRVVMTGVQHPDRAEHEAQLATRRLQIALDEGRMTVNHLRVVNIVGSCTMPHRLPIGRMSFPSEKFPKAIYDTTIFPALRLKLSIDDNQTATCLLYHSGKVIITGVPTEEKLNQAFTTLLPYLQI